MEKLLWQCDMHPNAEILHSWDNVRYNWGDGRPRGQGTENHTYACNECGQELSPSKEE